MDGRMDVFITYVICIFHVSGEILSTKYYYRFIIEIKFSWVSQIQWGFGKCCRGRILDIKY